MCKTHSFCLFCANSEPPNAPNVCFNHFSNHKCIHAMGFPTILDKIRFESTIQWQKQSQRETREERGEIIYMSDENVRWKYQIQINDFYWMTGGDRSKCNFFSLRLFACPLGTPGPKGPRGACGRAGWQRHINLRSKNPLGKALLEKCLQAFK